MKHIVSSETGQTFSMASRFGMAKMIYLGNDILRKQSSRPWAACSDRDVLMRLTSICEREGFHCLTVGVLDSSCTTGRHTHRLGSGDNDMNVATQSIQAVPHFGFANTTKLPAQHI